MSKHSKKLDIDASGIKSSLSKYRAVLNPLRLQLLAYIKKQKSVNVSAIIKYFELEQPLISAQLRILREAGFLKIKREGRSIFYSIDPSALNRLTSLTAKLVPFKATPVASLRDTQGSGRSQGGVRFSPTELKVIRLVCEQNTSDEIAQKLNLSRRTIEDYRSDIIKKMNVRNSVGILIYAVKNGLFSLGTKSQSRG